MGLAVLGSGMAAVGFVRRRKKPDRGKAGLEKTMPAVTIWM